MNRLVSLRRLAFLAAVVTILASTAQLAHAVDRPNVLLIYTDDHRASGVGALGGHQVQTPNIDSLAKEGITFRRTYLMGSFLGATCVPSRAMLLTGRNLFDLHRDGRTIPAEHTTISQAFKAAGYDTAIVGKWHQDQASLARCFDDGRTVMGLGAYLVDHFRMPLWDWKTEEPKRYRPQDAYLLEYDEDGNVRRRPFSKSDQRGPIATEATGPHTSEIFADSAIKFFEDRQASNKATNPFFMYLAFHAPHDPRQAPKQYRDMYRVDEMKLPPSTMPQHPFDNGHMVIRDEQLAPFPRTLKDRQQQLADYYSIITHLDAQIGRVVEGLKATGQYDNTLVVLAGDSGLAVGCHGLMGKQNVYDEDGVHVPFIISGGNIHSRGQVVDALCYTHDISPTICDLAGVEKPKSMTGKSLQSVIQGKQSQIRDFTYHAYRQHQRALRHDGYKLIEYVRAPDADKQRGDFVSGSRVTQLFHVDEDPWETVDLSIHGEHAQRIESMRSLLREQAKRLEDNNENTGQAVDYWDHFE